MTEPTFDPDGYPTEETLNAIRAWSGDLNELMVVIKKAWKFSEWGWQDATRIN